VTLDGDQRFKHDLLLLPTVWLTLKNKQANSGIGRQGGDGNEENKESRRPNALVATG
jgi:hypothetical protein